MCPVCGIAGLYSPAGPPNPELVDAMRAALVHRGPDEGSTDAFGHCVLGHQRLKVIDLETGYQPVSNARGDVVAVFNGEAYNFMSLRDELAAQADAANTPAHESDSVHSPSSNSTGANP
jgi:asparagine synthase (glutamine-hydrolysing)